MTMKTLLKRIIPDEFFHEEKKKNSQVRNFTEKPLVTKIKKPAMMHGMACLRDGKVVVTDPQNDGSYATIVVPDHSSVQVFVDGEQVHGEVVLSESSSVDIRIDHLDPSISYETVVSDDKLSVMVKANVLNGLRFSLRDTEPARQLRLGIDESAVMPVSSSREVILSLLSDNGYQGEIDEDAVERLCTTISDREEIVLRGTLPKMGLPGRIRESAAFHPERDEPFKINRCPVALIGTTIAVIEPAVNGVPGKDVYGELIPPQTDRGSPLPSLGNGVIRVNKDVVAVEEGRARYTKHSIDVIPEMVFERDINGLQGEVRFDGNIIVRGSVKNHATLKASGMIVIYGSVDNSSVLGENGVFVSEEIKYSKIMTGYQELTYMNLSDFLDGLILHLERFHEDYMTMHEHVIKRIDRDKMFPQIPIALFEIRYPDLEQELGDFIRGYQDELTELDRDYQKLKDVIEKKWQGKSRLQVSMEDTNDLLENIQVFQKKIKNRPKEHPVIRARTVVSSTLQSLGNIIVTENSYSSTLESGCSISVHHNLRGGFAVAEKAVYVAELGNATGTETSVRVNDANGWVRVKLNHENTMIQVGENRHRSASKERDVRKGGINGDQCIDC